MNRARSTGACREFLRPSKDGRGANCTGYFKRKVQCAICFDFPPFLIFGTNSE